MHILLLLKNRVACWLLFSLFLSLKVSGQSILTGRVIDEEKSLPISGVTVQVKGSSVGTSTATDGSFSISVKIGDILVVSNVGFQQREILVGNLLNLEVVLTNSRNSLNEVVVMGYSSQKKKDITGAVSVVDMKAVNSIPTGAASQALQGQAAGVTVISSGAPGGRNDIFIRGVTSFGNTAPLYIIDGVQGNMDNLNTSDIESIQVLKDAGAASIYGVRGSNGVIVITTKKGKSGKSSISLESYYGMQYPHGGNVFNLMNSENYAKTVKLVSPTTQLFKDGLPDFTYAGPGGISGTGMAGDPAVDPSKYNFEENNPANMYLIQAINKTGTDWFHEVFKPAPIQNHTLSVSGGNDKGNYLFSLGYLDQQGTLIETYLKRYSARINTVFKPHKNVRIGENAYVYYKNNPGFANQSENNAISSTYRIMGVIPVRDIRGNYGGTWLGPEFGEGENGVAMQENTRNNKNNTWAITGNVFGEVDFLRHFTLRTSFGGIVENYYAYFISPNRYHSKQDHFSENSFNESASFTSSWTWTNTLKYVRQIGEHDISVIVGSEAIKNSGRYVGGAANNFFSLDPNYLLLTNGTTGIRNMNTAYINSLYSLFSRLDYAFRDKYLLSATFRRDGSSVFGEDKRYGVFPSVSLGWRLSGEKFMEQIKFINDLKFRGSYGVLGSQANISPSNAFSLYGGGFGSSYYDITGSNNSTQQGFRQISIGNPATGWEENVITNIGLDARLFKEHIDLSIDWYRKSINGLLFPLPLPSTVGGATPPTVNIGDIENKGIDISLAYRGKVNELGFTVGLNFGTYKNKVINIPEPGFFETAGSRIGSIVRNQIGKPVGSFYGYEVTGLFQNDEDVAKSPEQTDAAPGRFKYRDINIDNKITPDDRTFFGNPNPDFTYGLNLGLTFKGFDLSAIFYGSQGNDVFNQVRYYTDFMGTSVGKGKSNVLLDAWRPDNANSSVPVLESASSFSTNGVINSYYLEDGSFFKLRSLILGYNLSPGVLKKFGVERFRIYMQAANLFTITNYSGIDPELTGNLGGTQSSAAFGIDYGNYPNNQRSVLVGLNLKF